MTLRGQVEALRRQLADMEARTDETVAQRVALILRAMRINGNADYANKSESQIRATAVAAALGVEAIDGKAPDYIAAHFDHLAEQAEQDDVRRVLRGVVH